MRALLFCFALAAQAQLLDVRKIWDAAPHNAFTDLVRHHNALWCVFREGSAHVSPDGAIRVLTSRDGGTWTSAALIRSNDGDLRDPHLSITPRGEMMLVAAAALKPGSPARHQTYAWFSKNGKTWSEPTPIGDPDLWLWRVVWNHKKEAFGFAYTTTGATPNRIYRSTDGRHFESLGDAPTECGVNETGTAFAQDGTRYVLERRDQCGKTAALWTTTAQGSTERALNAYVGGPVLIQLPDGRLLGAGRMITENRARTSVFWLDPATASIQEIVALPSGGDTSYPGLVFHDGIVSISYYSSHEGKTAIYFAKFKLP